jgi:hypothetical protein
MGNLWELLLALALDHTSSMELGLLSVLLMAKKLGQWMALESDQTTARL